MTVRRQDRTPHRSPRSGLAGLCIPLRTASVNCLLCPFPFLLPIQVLCVFCFPSPHCFQPTAIHSQQRAPPETHRDKTGLLYKLRLVPRTQMCSVQAGHADFTPEANPIRATRTLRLLLGFFLVSSQKVQTQQSTDSHGISERV